MKNPYDAQKEHRWRFRFVERRVMLLNGDIVAEAFALVFSLYIWGNQAEFLCAWMVLFYAVYLVVFVN
jgi:hypothetical protein